MTTHCLADLIISINLIGDEIAYLTLKQFLPLTYREALFEFTINYPTLFLCSRMYTFYGTCCQRVNYMSD